MSVSVSECHHERLQSSELCSLGCNQFIQVLELSQFLLVVPSESTGLSNELCHLAANLLALWLISQIVHISDQTFSNFVDGFSARFKLLQAVLFWPYAWDSFLLLSFSRWFRYLVLAAAAGVRSSGIRATFLTPPCSNT